MRAIVQYFLFQDAFRYFFSSQKNSDEAGRPRAHIPHVEHPPKNPREEGIRTGTWKDGRPTEAPETHDVDKSCSLEIPELEKAAQDGLYNGALFANARWQGQSYEHIASVFKRLTESSQKTFCSRDLYWNMELTGVLKTGGAVKEAERCESVQPRNNCNPQKDPQKEGIRTGQWREGRPTDAPGKHDGDKSCSLEIPELEKAAGDKWYDGSLFANARWTGQSEQHIASVFKRLTESSQKAFCSRDLYWNMELTGVLKTGGAAKEANLCESVQPKVK